jgi:hypothetical protein
MSAFVVKNASFWISNGAALVAVTAATKGATTALTVTNSLSAGDFVYVTNSGWASLDGKFGKVAASPAPTATSVTVDLDTSGETVAFGSAAQASLLSASAWLEACVAGFDIAGGAADSISVGTFCDSSAALAGAPGAATVALTGFVDITSNGYMELIKAANDGLPRSFKFIMPQSAAPGDSAPPVMLFNGTVSFPDQSYQTGAAAGFTCSVTLSGRPTLVRTPAP